MGGSDPSEIAPYKGEECDECGWIAKNCNCQQSSKNSSVDDLQKKKPWTRKDWIDTIIILLFFFFVFGFIGWSCVESAIEIVRETQAR